MTREQLIYLVRILKIVGKLQEEEFDYLMGLFEKYVPDPHAVDLFYDKKYRDYTAEQIVDAALSYEIIALPPYKGKE